MKRPDPLSSHVVFASNRKGNAHDLVENLSLSHYYFDYKQNKATESKPYIPSPTMKTSNSLILVIASFVSFLDPASAVQVYCLSDADVDDACAAELFDPRAEFEETMAEEMSIMQLGDNRNLRSDDERELSNACAYCRQYPERWCAEYPYNECRRRVLEVTPISVTAEVECETMVLTAEMEFSNILPNESLNEECVEALMSIQCFCNTN
jgi:hypothetical protein